MKILRILLVIVLLVVAGRALDANAQTVTVLYSFASSPTGGGFPEAGLLQGSDGNFYGTTLAGGTGGSGTVFRVSPNGTYTNLYFFGSSPTDGVYLCAGLVQGSDGNFYGTSLAGGTHGNGTFFRISASGSYTNLYSFIGYPTDGNGPNGLLKASDGNFYGTTQGGGTNYVSGTVFRISASGNETNLYSFGGYPADGRNPQAGLAQGRDGNFYGTTAEGGTYSNGTMFRISPSGTYTSLYSFAGSPDGASPSAGLVQGSDGNFYGTTQGGGTGNSGTVFRVSPNGTYTNLYFFGSSPNDGYQPLAGLVQGSDGNFYGTTMRGGTNNDGTVFKLTVSLNPPPYPINQITEVQLSDTNIVFNIPSIAGETYQLQFTTDPTSGTWSNVPGVSVTNCIGALLTLTNFLGASQTQGFYRFAITP